jgi:hypothetical protein
MFLIVLPLGVRDLRVFTIEQESPATRELPHSADRSMSRGATSRRSGSR